MASTINLTASADYGHTGQYIARITGRDSKFTFRREFLGRKCGKRNEGSEATVDDAGLYVCCDVDRKRGKQDRFVLVLEHEEGLVELRSDREDAMAIAKALDAGRAFPDIVRATAGEGGRVVYEILSAKQAERAQAAATVESAVAACWAAVEALPAREATKVLAALRERLRASKDGAFAAAIENVQTVLGDTPQAESVDAAVA